MDKWGYDMQVELAGFADGLELGRGVSERKRRIESDLCFYLSK